MLTRDKLPQTVSNNTEGLLVTVATYPGHIMGMTPGGSVWRTKGGMLAITLNTGDKVVVNGQGGFAVFEEVLENG